jgi:hypothetical protein
MDEQPPEPRSFYLNEQHELHGEKTGGVRLPRYTGINWAVKGQGIHRSLQSVASRVRQSRDPLREKRYYLLAKPEREVNKLRKNKKTGQMEPRAEETDYSGEHTRVFGRLGIDLIEVTDDGNAIVHATPERLTQLSARAESLVQLGTREQARWATIGSFDLIPPQLRIDPGWIRELPVDESTDVVVELQPLLTHVEIEIVLRAISDMLLDRSTERLTGTGTDFSGRQWLRGQLTPRSLRTIAKDFFSVQSLHPPFYSLAAAKQSSRTRPSLGSAVSMHNVPRDIESFPSVAVFDSGVPAGHKYLEPYRRGQYIGEDTTGRPGDHGSRVASRIVFGEQDFYAGIDSERLAGRCRFLDVQVSMGFGRFDDLGIMDALEPVARNYPDVRVFNFSFAASRPPQLCEPVERQARMTLTQNLDNFVFANDVLVVVAAGNTESGVVPRIPYPRHVDDPSWRLGHWASGFNTLVCGSYVGHLSPNGMVKHVGWPSPFTKIGPGACDCPVPNYGASGGNWNEDYRFQAGLGVWVCDSQGRWEDHAGTSHAAPLLAREAALALRFLEERCASGAHPFAATVKAFLALTASQPYETAAVPQDVKVLCRRTLGRGTGKADRLANPGASTAVLLWQGVLEGPTDQIQVQIPVPRDWWRRSKNPRLRLIVAYEPPVNAGVHDTWACRRVDARLRPGPDADALRSVTRSSDHRSYPLLDRLYDLRRLSGDDVDGELWVLELEYRETADYSPGIDFTPQQRVAFAAELFDAGETPLSPQGFLQALPIAATMTRLSIQPVVVRNPVIIKTRI